MCTVDKLLIKGVRSFSPDNQDVIEFFKPLTLIVGQNGAGKTTVIECLKQACTGELPPNTRSGQSFIHDPKVAGQTEVKAQIKLRFRTSTGQPVVVVRSFQLLQKKTALQFKTLDSTLQTMNKDTGEKQAITYKCADIDRIIPSLMGVSKAVLENVIFVHQEDSNWPLAEGQVLKKKFDDIFAATKYTKALEALRKIRTEKTQQCREHRLLLDHLGTKKEHAARIRATLATAEAARTRLDAEVQALEPLIQEQEHLLTELSRQLDQMAAKERVIQDVAITLQLQSQTTEQAFVAIKREDFEEGTDELRAWLQQCEAQMVELKAQVEAKTNLAQRLKEEAAIVDNAIKKLEEARGQMEAEKLNHEARIRSRDELLREAALRGDITLPAGAAGPGLLSAGAVSQMVGAVEAHAQQLHAALEQLKADNRKEDGRMGDEVQAKVKELTAIAEGVTSRRSRLGQIGKQLEAKGHELSRVMITRASVEDAKAKEEEAKRRLQDKSDDIQRQQLDAAVVAEKAAMDAAQQRISALRMELTHAQAASSAQEQLQYKKSEVTADEEQLEAALASRRARLLGLLGTPQLPPVEQLRERVEQAVRDKEREAREAGNRLRMLTDKHSSIQGELRAVRPQLERAEAAIAEAEMKLREGMRQALGQEQEASEYDAALEKQEAATEKTLKKVSLASSMLEVMHSYREAAEEEHCCPLCRRNFQEGEEEQTLEFMNEELAALPDKLAQKEAQLEELRRKVAELRALQSVWHRFQELGGSSLPPLREKAQALQAQVQGLASQVEEAGGVVALTKHEEDEARRVQKDVLQHVLSLHTALDKKRDELRQLQQRAAAAGLGRTATDVNSELEEEQRVHSRHQRELMDLQDRKMRLTNEEAALKSKFHTAEMQLQAAIQTMQQRLQLEKQVKELEEEQAGIRGAISEMEAQRQPLDADRERLLKAREAARRAADEREREAGDRVMQVVQRRDRLRSLIQDIRTYQAADKEGVLARLKEDIEGRKGESAGKVETARQLEGEVNGFQTRKLEQEAIKKEIEDVLKYRDSRDKEAALKVQKAALEAELVQMGDREAMQRERHEAQGRREGLMEQKNRFLGELRSVAATASQAQRDLAQPEYRGVEDKYRQQQVKLKTTEMAQGDVEKYHKALEKALLAFHSSKMADINRIVKELWQKTYRGQDIDYIAIKADADGLRSYNYRVVMYSRGAELDMRGRCSAGQKVLASLVIRLALAETFCLSCGILALDEPTTNLDAANAASLAEALASVMQNRVGQDNFQLIVITHDEKFAQMIGSREHVDQLWRITKNEQQHTSVRAEPITD